MQNLVLPHLFSRLPLLAAALVLVSGCQSTYYGVMERFGIEKRDLLIERVEEARDAQEETKEQFTDALEQFSALVDFDGGELERLYDRLQTELKDSEAAASRVSERITAIETVAGDLFREWERELGNYSSESLRRQSQQQLQAAREQYRELMQRMRAVEERIEPVLVAFRDQVLFLKHNLNARAVADLEDEAASIRSDVEDLIKAMEASIAEANSFIDAMR